MDKEMRKNLSDEQTVQAFSTAAREEQGKQGGIQVPLESYIQKVLVDGIVAKAKQGASVLKPKN